jgi:hypothetical protein
MADIVQPDHQRIVIQDKGEACSIMLHRDGSLFVPLYTLLH